MSTDAGADAQDPPPPDNVSAGERVGDPFDALALPPSFDLDAARIERAYLARAAAIHPDLADADPLVQADAGRRSAALNDARATLLDPERRAVALLARLGGPSASDDRSLPDDFLMQMMQTRTQIDEDLAQDPDEARARWRRWASDRRAEHIDAVRELFASLGAPPAPRSLAAVRERLNAWRYIERLAEQLDPDHATGHAPGGM